MNTIELLGEEETFKNIVEHKITELEDNKIDIIRNYAFYYCSSLTSVFFPNATSIGEYAFNGCSSLTSVSFPVASSIGINAFNGCSGLTEVSIPNATDIGGGAFNGCSGLTSVSFPNATSIGNNAFYSCSGLTEVSFPVATSIGNYAFYNCSKLTTIYVGTESNTVCTLKNTNAIPSSVTDIYVPEALVNLYKTATNWSSFASKIKAYTGV